MSYQAYIESKKLLLEDPPYYALIAAANLVATPDEQARIEQAWGHELRKRDYDLKFGIWLVDNNPEFTIESYLFAAIVNADTNNMMRFELHFHHMLAERRARYHSPGGRLAGDPELVTD
jgi:hypothetical protein